MVFYVYSGIMNNTQVSSTMSGRVYHLMHGDGGVSIERTLGKRAIALNFYSIYSQAIKRISRESH